MIPTWGGPSGTLAALLERRGDLTRAEEMDLRALAILEKAEGRARLQAGSVLNNLGVIYLGRRDYQRAGEYLERGLPLMEAAYGADSIYVATPLQNLGIVAREAKDYAKAEAYYLRALASREKNLGPEHPDIAATLINIANVYRSKGDYPLALETHLRALRMFERTAGPGAPFTLLSLVNVARTYAVLGDLANAVTYQTRLEQATETAIALNLSIGSERQRVAYLTPIAERTERTLSLNLQMTPGDPDSTALAVTVLLQRKGRVIDAAADMQAALRRHADSDGQALLDQLNDVVGQLARLVLNGPQKTPVDEYRKSIAALEGRKEQLESQIGRRSAEFRAASVPVTLEAVQAAIPADAALIEFAAYRPFDPAIDSVGAAFGKLRYAAYVVHRTARRAPWISARRRRSTRRWRRCVERWADPARSDVRRLSRALDDAVMRPVRGLVGDSTQLLVSPDGALNLIPFEALVDERGRYLVQRYRCTYLTSGRDLLRMQVAREAQHGPLIVARSGIRRTDRGVFGAPSRLPRHATRERRRSVTSARDLSEVYFAPIAGTAREAQAIRMLFPDATVLAGERATESSLRQFAAPAHAAHRDARVLPAVCRHRAEGRHDGERRRSRPGSAAAGRAGARARECPWRDRTGRRRADGARSVAAEPVGHQAGGALGLRYRRRRGAKRRRRVRAAAGVRALRRRVDAHDPVAGQRHLDRAADAKLLPEPQARKRSRRIASSRAARHAGTQSPPPSLLLGQLHPVRRLGGPRRHAALTAAGAGVPFEAPASRSALGRR